MAGNIMSIALSKEDMYEKTLPKDLNHDTTIETMMKYAQDAAGIKYIDLMEARDGLARRKGGPMVALLRDMRDDFPIVLVC